MILLALLGIFTTTAYAGDFQATFASTYSKVEGNSSSTLGVSARMRYVFAKRSSGFFIQSSFPSNSITNYDAIVGYVLRSQGKVFWELGGGIRHSDFWGTGLGLLGAVGTDLNSNWYVTLPVIYRMGYSIEYTPYVGYRF